MMNKEEQRIAIAKWMGIEVPFFGCDYDNGCYDDCLFSYRESLVKLPDYLEDLNACHNAEIRLSREQTLRYMSILFNMVGEGKWQGSATAAQRCEALCRTLWPERWAANL